MDSLVGRLEAKSLPVTLPRSGKHYVFLSQGWLLPRCLVRNPKVIGKAPSANVGLLKISARVTQEESIWKRGPV